MSRKDPKITSRAGDPLCTFLKHKIPYMPLASLNYRLSPAVRHPAHVNDILAAIEHLKDEYEMKEFVVVGHSVGACLAFQTCHVQGCRGVVGVEGIYDIPGLIEEYPKYRDFVEAAMGSDESVWKEASPTTILDKLGKEFKLDVLLIQSREDELLSSRQTDRMLEILRENTNAQVDAVAWINGQHDACLSTTEFHELVYTFLTQKFKI